MKTRWRIKLVLDWADFWVGFYWDRDDKQLYIFLVPAIGVCIYRSPS